MHLHHGAIPTATSPFAAPADGPLSRVLCLELQVSGRTLGSLSVHCSAHRRQRALLEQAAGAARPFASHAAVVLANALDHAEVRHRLRVAQGSRAVVEQAQQQRHGWPQAALEPRTGAPPAVPGRAMVSTG